MTDYGNTRGNEPGNAYIVSYSGGLDSTTVLYAAATTCAGSNGRDVAVAVHIRLSDPSITKRCRAICDDIGVELFELDPLPNHMSANALADTGLPPWCVDCIRHDYVIELVKVATLMKYPNKSIVICGTINANKYQLCTPSNNIVLNEYEPLINMTKAQVRQIAKKLRVPDDIIRATPTLDINYDVLRDPDTVSDMRRLGAGYKAKMNMPYQLSRFTSTSNYFNMRSYLLS